jgi:hypothetical protein
MKKTFLFLGLFILSLSTILTSCNNEPDEVILTNNVITIGDAISPITSVSSKTEDKDTFIIVDTDAIELVFEFDNNESIPLGNIELTLNGSNTAEITMLWSGVEYILTGNLSISMSNDTYTLNAVGNAFSGYYSFVPFSIYYNGKIK